MDIKDENTDVLRNELNTHKDKFENEIRNNNYQFHFENEIRNNNYQYKELNINFILPEDKLFFYLREFNIKNIKDIQILLPFNIQNNYQMYKNEKIKDYNIEIELNENKKLKRQRQYYFLKNIFLDDLIFLNILFGNNIFDENKTILSFANSSILSFAKNILIEKEDLSFNFHITNNKSIINNNSVENNLEEEKCILKIIYSDEIELERKNTNNELKKKEIYLKYDRFKGIDSNNYVTLYNCVSLVLGEDIDTNYSNVNYKLLFIYFNEEVMDIIKNCETEFLIFKFIFRKEDYITKKENTNHELVFLISIEDILTFNLDEYLGEIDQGNYFNENENENELINRNSNKHIIPIHKYLYENNDIHSFLEKIDIIKNSNLQNYIVENDQSIINKVIEEDNNYANNIDSLVSLKVFMKVNKYHDSLRDSNFDLYLFHI